VVKNYLQYRRHGFSPWVRNIPWRRKWQPTPLFLPGKSHVQRSPVGYSPCSCKRITQDLAKQNVFFLQNIEIKLKIETMLKLYISEVWMYFFTNGNEKAIQFSSVVQSCQTLCNPMNRRVPDLPVHHQLPEFIQTHVHPVGDAIQPSHPLSSPSPPAPTPSQHQGLSTGSTLHMRWPKYWSFSYSITHFKEHPGLISFRMDWLDLLAVQGTCKSLLQHHSSKASILRHSAFFTVQLSHPYMTTGKTIALTRWTFVGKVTSLLLNMLSRLVITFLPRSKSLLIS